jgi:hypothetical protein
MFSETPLETHLSTLLAARGGWVPASTLKPGPQLVQWEHEVFSVYRHSKFPPSQANRSFQLLSRQPTSDATLLATFKTMGHFTSSQYTEM